MVPDGIFPSMREVKNKKDKNCSTIGSSKNSKTPAEELSDQFDPVDQEMAMEVSHFIPSDGIDLNVGTSDEEQFPKEEDLDDQTSQTSPEADEDSDVEEMEFELHMVDLPKDQEEEIRSVTGMEVQFSNKAEDFDMLKENPAFKKLCMKFAMEEWGTTPQKAGAGNNSVPKGDSTKRRISTDPETGKGNKGKRKDVTKSPSDTTIYALAFNKPVGGIVPIPMEGLAITSEVSDVCDQPIQNESKTDEIRLESNYSNIFPEQESYSQPSDIANQIIQFIEGIRRKSTQDNPQPGTSGWTQPMRQETVEERQIAVAREKANCQIVEAEKFRASVNAPPGMDINLVNHTATLDMDDQFFYITCHLDDALKKRIERGEFVELDKLLPKIRGNQVL